MLIHKLFEIKDNVLEMAASALRDVTVTQINKVSAVLISFL